MDKKSINIVWFKRDYRITDNEALFYAHQSEEPLLFICFFEPSIMNYPDSDVRHWRFIYESIQDLDKKLKPSNSKMYFFHIWGFIYFQMHLIISVDFFLFFLALER